MISTELICSNFITFKLNTKHLLAQHTPPPPPQGCILQPSPWQLPDGFTEPYRCCDTTPGQLPVQFPCHCWSSAPSETQCCVHVLSPPDCR
jgi:hypothetical protein